MSKSGKVTKARATLNKDVAQDKLARTMDALIEFDTFNATILPQLRKMVQENWSPDKIRKHFAPMVQAMAVQKALNGSEKMMMDLLNRHEGMPVQKIENKTIYAKLEGKELAALALQKLRDAKIIDTTGRVIREDALEKPDTE